jgi:hypothetical protein
MGKINWTRVFLGGLLAGVVLNVLGYAAWAIYLRNAWGSELEALGHPVRESGGFIIFWIVFYLVVGILATWLYAAIRPRCGAGLRTALLAGFAFWVLGGLLPAISLGPMGLFSVSLLALRSLTYLVIVVVGTLLGAWVYKEET